MLGERNEDDADQPKLGELIPLSLAAEICGLSSPHLRLLVGRGDLWGKKLGRNWVTTEEAVREYMARDRRPGPKPDTASRPNLRND